MKTIFTKLEKYLSYQFKLVLKLRYMYLMIGLSFTVFGCMYNLKIKSLEKKVAVLNMRLNNQHKNYIALESAFKQVNEEKEVNLRIINEKVDSIDTVLGKLYSGYSYKNKIKEAVYYQDKSDVGYYDQSSPAGLRYDQKKIEELPNDLLGILIQKKFLEPHGVKNYELTFKNLIWPMDVESTFVATKRSEYGQYRPYSLYAWQHEATDLNNFYSDSVKAVYDATVWRKYYDEAGGWTLEIKYEYTTKEGDKEWHFDRFRHMDKIYVNKGDTIKQGDIIASMGNTGFFSSGKHLHWETWVLLNGNWVNVNPVQNSTWNNKYIEKLKY